MGQSDAFRLLGDAARKAGEMLNTLADKLIDADSLCPECGHDKEREDYLGFCSSCRIDSGPCSR